MGSNVCKVPIQPVCFFTLCVHITYYFINSVSDVCGVRGLNQSNHCGDDKGSGNMISSGIDEDFWQAGDTTLLNDTTTSQVANNKHDMVMSIAWTCGIGPLQWLLVIPS